ncbi:MAG: MEDS domain-containing protein [bacterium]
MHLKTSDMEELTLGIGNYSCNWGLHIAGLYETEQDRDEIIFGFLKQGLLDGDLQLYCPVERTKQNFIDEFSIFCPDCKEHLSNNTKFEILTAKELYYPNDVFDPLYMDKALNSFFIKTQLNGRRNIRATAEMVWALEAIKGVKNLFVYESRLNYFIANKPWISICLYNVNKFSGAMIMNVLRTHPYTINGGVITKNPYFIHPDEWLDANATEFKI